ncbi:restriction endonuclease subunit S [Faecalibacterium duncaniae]|uniref:restriction endonuclease subunit S n=1 Tax=Faecalibacterium duncaniae (strain DSM 17677 / JCM 31915 / A2-165) TaxID=411483 RepID=UPI00294109AA|nr:restriction endonuclease subunit S [Faecalibacterium duncaniae]MDV5049621.1 restriction endonuclease subunit S [Faecalibacterium duncaniae]
MRYEKYKKSISPFLEEIPFHWKETYLSHAYSLSSDTGHTEEQLLSVFLDKGVVSYSSTDQKQVHKPSEDMSKYQLVNPGDFVINNQQAWRGSVGISRYKGIVSPAYYIWRPRKDNNPYYMNYLFRDHYIIDQFVLASKGVGSIQRQVYVPYMKRIILSIPPREEQNQIVRYLDWQVSKINKLIHGYQRQIKLLEERRQTVIDRAVTKGVRQGRQMHSIQANWMGDIPADWKMIPSKRLFLESKERKHPDDKPATASQKYGIILQEDYMKSENKRIVIATQGLDDWKHVEPDNFVISLRSFQGGIERSEIFGCVTWHYIVLLPQKYVVPRYFKWLLKSKSYIKALQGTSEFIRDGQDLRYSNFVKVDLPLIPASEQEEIADYIEQETAKIDRAIPVLEKEIELLKEYRTRLISDVVTGQMDVRNVEVPEYTPEEDIAEEAPEEQEVEMDAD